VGKSEGKRPLGRRRWVDNIKIDLRNKMGWSGFDSDQWRALVNMILNLRVPLNAVKFLRVCTIGGSTRRAQLRK
jgi:hypothetical protein